MVKENFDSVFAALTTILKKYERRLAVKATGPNEYYLESKTPVWKGRPMMFAAVRRGKRYVSYHLIPVCACPELIKSMSPALKKQMHGKACFNFKRVDKKLFAELARVTAAGAKAFRSCGWL
jgi:hypothetical protein